MMASDLARRAWCLLAAGFLAVGCVPTDSNPPDGSDDESTDPPVATFSASITKGVAPLQVSFDASASEQAGGPIVTYNWNFGDGQLGRGKSVAHTYGLPGEYRIRLTVIGPTNKQDESDLDVSVLIGVSSIEVTPAQLGFAAAGLTERLTVRGILTGSQTVDLSGSTVGTTYTSSDPTVATVDAGGLVTAKASGNANILVQYGDLTPVFVPVTVTILDVVSLKVTPANITFSAPGQRQALNVTANLADGGTVDVTASMLGTRYSTTNSIVASVDSEGLVTARAAGDAVLGVRFGNLTPVPIPVRVVMASSFSVEPSDIIFMEPGQTRNFVVTAVLSDASKVVVTQDEFADNGASYSSSNSAVASVDENGRVTANDVGVAVISVKFGVLPAETVSVRVYDLDSFTVAPTAVIFTQLLQTRNLTVTALLADGTALDVTAPRFGTTYTSGNPVIAPVSADGLITAGAIGSANITVTLSNQPAVTVPVRVLDVTSITVSPSQISFTEAGETRDLIVTANLSNGGIMDVTGPDFGTTYASTDTTVATVDANGVVTAHTSGTAAVTVRFGHLDPVTVPVMVLALDSLEVTPSELRFRLINEIQPLAVEATFTDASTRNVTAGSSGTTYVSSNSAVAIADPDGNISARAAGTATITVDYRSLAQVSVPVTVAPLAVASIAVTPSVVNFTDLNQALNLAVTATLSDDSTIDVTGSHFGTTYVSDDPTVVTVTEEGLLTAMAEGDADITVTFPGQTPVTVPIHVLVLEPVSVEVTPPTISLTVLGQIQPLTVMVTFNNDQTLDATAAGLGTTYVSGNIGVATVSVGGLVTARGSGTTAITVTYQSLPPVTVPVTVTIIEPLLAGVSARVITPVTPDGTPLANSSRTVNHTHPVYLAGFDNNRTASAVNDDLWARCLALRSADTTVAIVSLDLVGYSYHWVQEIRSLLSQSTSVDYLLVTSTHVHEGPDTIGFWGRDPFTTGVDPNYIDFVNTEVVQAVRDAVAAMVPVDIKTATTTSQGLSLGTDDKDDGMGVADGKVLAGDDLVTGVPSNVAGRIVDPTITAIQFLATGTDTAIATYVSFGSHPECMGPQSVLTSDFPHYVRQRLESVLGGTAIYVSADVGVLQGPLWIDIRDPSTGQTAARRTFRWAEVHGTDLADRAIDALQAVTTPVKGAALDFRTTTPVDIPLASPYFRNAFGTQLVYPGRALYTNGAEDNRTGVDPDLGLVTIGLGEDLRTEVGAVRIGDYCLIVTPGELDPQLGFRYRALMTNAQGTHIIGLGNDEIGYQLPADKWDNSCHACGYYELAGQLDLCPQADSRDCSTVFQNNAGQEVETYLTQSFTTLLTGFNSQFSRSPSTRR